MRHCFARVIAGLILCLASVALAASPAAACGGRPVLSVSGETLHWTAAACSGKYIEERRASTTNFVEIVGTSDTPPAVSGATVVYRVRARYRRRSWSNEVTIGYSGETQQEREAREAREKAEREAKEKAEQEAREKAEREAKEKAEREAREKAEQEAKEKAEREQKEREEKEKASTQPHVMLIVEENRNRSQVVGSPQMPYFNSLLQKYGNTTAWDGVSHPSLPNYLALASGSTQGVTDDSCSHVFTGETIASQLNTAGIGWRSYDEALPSAGSTTCESYPYAKKHNPFAYFPVNGPNVVPASQFSTDLSGGKLPPFVSYVPGLCNDGHDCSNEVVDNYLKGLIPGVLASQWYAENGTIIITWDEDEGEGKIATIVLHGGGEAKVLTTPGNHYGTLATIEDLYKVPRLGNAAGATTLTPLLEPASALWTADGEKGGATNNPFLEWNAYEGVGYKNEGHPGINLRTKMQAADGEHPPLQGRYLYEYELKWWEGKTELSQYGDRLEMLGQHEPADTHPIMPANVAEQKEGTEMWIAFAYYLPVVPHNEVSWSENSYGSLPIWQMHGAGSSVPTFGAMVIGTRPGGYHGPTLVQAVTGPGNVALWTDEAKAATWYKFLYHYKLLASGGWVEAWGNNGDGTGFSKYGKRTGYTTFDASFMHPDQGGPRNENTKGATWSEPAITVRWYMDGFTFANTRVAATANAFGKAE